MKVALENHPAYDPILTAQQAADYCGCHVETLRDKARKREIACIKDPSKSKGAIRFRLSALNAWARRYEQKPMRQSATA